MDKQTVETLSDDNQSNIKNIRIILADDHPLIRNALKDAFKKYPNLEVIGEAEDGESVVKLTSEKLPDVVIMDISMPKLNGIEATKQIKINHPEVKILVLTIHDEMEHIAGILEAGADGYLIKNIGTEEIITAINALALGETILSPSVSKKIYRYIFQFATKSHDSRKSEKLTFKEIEMLKLLAKGISNKEIATISNLSVSTIKSYLAELFSKLGVNSRTEALISCLRNGILTIEDLN